ncbi:hypothetical protein LX24_00299 [Desulfallas thermosapovorans DSM 6562]|uniref:Uncharacterized protein n=1 Tax=Desulfallas thermosapovorans DSM 6562 TaxID=1121431 RepID=A0A5S4ZY45_9FIRM|nr:hypothetical protein LX24_00299 [Desulfallas thermosapovorans DSM 6562]
MLKYAKKYFNGGFLCQAAISDGKLINVDVRNYHWFARGYLSNVGMLGRWGDIVNTM